MGVWWYPELQRLGGPISSGMQGSAGIRDSCICISKDLRKQKNHMGSCSWARAEENQSMGQNVLLVPWVAQIPLLFWARFWVSSLLPLTLHLLWACSFLSLGSRTSFYTRLPTFILRFAPWWVFKWSTRSRISCLWSGCPYQQGGLDSEVLGTAQHQKKHLRHSSWRSSKIINSFAIGVYFLRLLGERKNTLFFFLQVIQRCFFSRILGSSTPKSDSSKTIWKTPCCRLLVALCVTELFPKSVEIEYLFSFLVPKMLHGNFEGCVHGIHCHQISGNWGANPELQ